MNLLRGLDDQMNSEPILDAMLVQRVPILEDLACEDQDQLILLCLKSPGDLLFKLFDRGSVADHSFLLVLGGLDGDPNGGPRLGPARLRHATAATRPPASPPRLLLQLVILNDCNYPKKLHTKVLLQI